MNPSAVPYLYNYLAAVKGTIVLELPIVLHVSSSLFCQMQVPSLSTFIPSGILERIGEDQTNLGLMYATEHAHSSPDINTPTYSDRR